MSAPRTQARRLPIAGTRETWREILRLGHARRWRVLAAGLSMIGGSASALLVPRILGHMVDVVVDGGAPTELISAAVWLAAVGLGSAAIAYLGGVLLVQVIQAILADLRETVVVTVLHLDQETIEASDSSDVVSRVTRDVEAVTEAASGVVPMVVAALFTILVSGIGILALDWRLALAALAALPVQLVALRWFIRRSRQTYADLRLAESDRGQAIIETVQGAESLRAHRRQEHRLVLVDHLSERVITLLRRAMRYATRFWTGVNMAEFTGLTAIIATSFVLVGGDVITIGAATAAALYFHRLFGPMGMLLTSVDDLLRAEVGLARLVGITRMPVEPQPPRTPRDPSQTADHDAIVLDGVSFAYPGGEPVLDGLSAELAGGRVTALVGPSGSGKSTLAQLVAGTLTAAEGSVRLAGGASPRERVTLITQETHLFEDTLAENLRLASPGADDEALLAALHRIGASWVDDLPEGLATRMGPGGTELGPARIQQLALARVLLMDPPIVVLDEATAEGGEAEAAVLDAGLAAVTRGRTAVIVAHRLSQAERADEILLLESGEVAERGTHDELLAHDGAYARLWEAWTAHREG